MCHRIAPLLNPSRKAAIVLSNICSDEQKQKGGMSKDTKFGWHGDEHDRENWKDKGREEELVERGRNDSKHCVITEIHSDVISAVFFKYL